MPRDPGGTHFRNPATRPRLVAAVLLGALLISGCGGDEGSSTTTTESPTTAAPSTSTSGSTTGPTTSDPAGVPSFQPEPIEERPHDPTAFTQGLVFDEQGRLFESTGLRGSSQIRELDPETGEVLRSASLEDRFFGEGLAVVDDHAIQITWQEGVALVWDLDTFEIVDEHLYDGEGWGLCHDGEQLVMSDGSATLTFRDPDTFEARGTVEVTRNGAPLAMLNELECVGDLVYANVWQTPQIVAIDPATGEVVASYLFPSLLTPEQAARADVLNGIAYQPDSDTFLVTGKDWPTMFVVELPL